jgi:hypothetical protein
MAKQSRISKVAEEATRRYESYNTRVKGSRPSSDAQLKVLKRDADRAKLALHRRPDGD